MLGPIGFVRRYVRKFALWALLFSMAYLTYWAISKSQLHAFWARPGKGGFPSFGQAVDLVIGSVVSWTPLAADYTRFARTRRGAAFGAGLGYFVPTIWCVGLGILIVLARGVGDAQALPAAVAAAGGVAFVALLAITIDESEKAFADIYSTAVSIQNLLPRLSQRFLITVVSAAATGLALVLNLGNYQNFLYLLGSFFVPLFGVLVGDWLAAGAHYGPAQIFAGASCQGRAARRLARRLRPLPVALAGRPVVVDEPRRAHASRQRQLHRLAAELRRVVRARVRVRTRGARRHGSCAGSRLVRPLAVIGHLSRDVVEGGAPRIGGGPWHTTRALRAMGENAASSRSAASRSAAPSIHASRRPVSSRHSPWPGRRRRSRCRTTSTACAL